jgi:hypothetical protein
MHEHQPVDSSEFVYRRIPRTYYQAGLPIPIQAAAFRPNKNDTTGLSVFRSAFVQPVGTLANIDARKRHDYNVAQIAVQDLHRLGLTVAPEPDPNGPLGHAIIPELAGISGRQAVLETGPGRAGETGKRCYRASTELTFGDHFSLLKYLYYLLSSPCP